MVKVAVLYYATKGDRVVLAFANANANASPMCDWAEFDDTADDRLYHDLWMEDAVGKQALLRAIACDDRKAFVSFLRRNGMLEFDWIVELVGQLPDPE